MVIVVACMRAVNTIIPPIILRTLIVVVVRPITGETTVAIIQSNTMGIVPKTIISIVLRTLIVVVSMRPIKSQTGIIDTWFVVHRALSFDHNTVAFSDTTRPLSFTPQSLYKSPALLLPPYSGDLD